MPAFARRTRLLAAFAAAWAVCSAVPALAASVTDVRVGVHPKFTRLVFELDASAGYKVEKLGTDAAPELRITIDAAAASRELRAAGDIRGVKIEAGTKARARIALRQPGLNVREMILSDPPRIVIDLVKSETALAAATKPAAKPEAKPEAKPAAKPEPKEIAKSEVKESAKPEAKEAIKPAAVESPKPEAKAKESAKPEIKETAKAEPKETAKAEVKDTAKEAVAKESPAPKPAPLQPSPAPTQTAAAPTTPAVAPKASPAPPAPAPTSALTPAPRVSPSPLPSPAASPAPSLAATPPTPSPAIEPPPAILPAPTESPTPDSDAKLIPPAPLPTSSPAIEPPRAPAHPMPSPVPAPSVAPEAPSVPAASWSERLTSDPLWIGAIAAALLGLAAIVLVLRRRRALPNDLDVTAIAEEVELTIDTPGRIPAGGFAMGDDSESRSASSDSTFAGLFDKPEERPAPSWSATPALEDAPMERSVPAAPVVAVAEDSLFDDAGDAPADPDSRQGDVAMDTDMDLPADRRMNPPAARMGGAAAPAASPDLMRMFQDMERRIATLEARLDESNEAREKLERQVAAQSEELRVQRAAIARTQRALRTMTRGDEDKATEPALRDGDTQAKTRVTP